MRCDERQHVSLEARQADAGVVVTARAALVGVEQTWTTTLPAGEVRLSLDTSPPETGFSADALGGDRIRLTASTTGEEEVLAELDGRYWTAETAASFTGRVVGAYVTEGTVAVTSFGYRGSEQP